MPKSLQSRKRQLVRDAIYDAAIELFAKKGFDETTVEEVAEAAGISRRSFFRYFESKDDLLALNTVNCGEKLCEAVKSCPASLGPLEVVRETVLAGVKFTESQEHTRQIIEIAQRSPSARQAHLSRLMEVEDKLAVAFSARMKGSTPFSLKSLLLSGMTMLIQNTATAAWYLGEHKDLTSAANHALLNLSQILCEEPAILLRDLAPVAGKRPGKSVPKMPAKRKK
ncbi:MAG TPA: TetR family transcriptional regulator [Terracidiphilus sp.]|nr:TetR family transcriptional regulator [Terracidiphilus sp.]